LGKDFKEQFENQFEHNLDRWAGGGGGRQKTRPA
jgi:hypothetical protein